MSFSSHSAAVSGARGRRWLDYRLHEKRAGLVEDKMISATDPVLMQAVESGAGEGHKSAKTGPSQSG